MKKIKKNIINALDYLEQNPTESISKTATIFNIDRHTLSDYQIKHIDKELLFESQNNKEFLYLFSNEELSIIQYYTQHSNEPAYKLKEKFPQAPSIRTLRRWMDILGKTYHTGAIQKYHYDKTKFLTIDTEEDAYWLGFITADGCIIENKCLQIKLAEKDKKHLQKFCNFLQLSKKETAEIIKTGTGGAYTKDNIVNTVRVHCKEIIKNLQDKGITPRKSEKEKPYICKNQELEKAYIRGLIDGDGFLHSNSYGIGLVGSYEICNYVLDFIYKIILQKTEKTNHIYKHGNIWKIDFTGKQQASKIIDFLYNNASIYLDRKYNLYLQHYKK